jgi:hypothetical protein
MFAFILFGDWTSSVSIRESEMEASRKNTTLKLTENSIRDWYNGLATGTVMKSKNVLLLFSLWIVSFCGHVNACNIADFLLLSTSYNSGTQQWTIVAQLSIGSGRTGAAAGADAATRTIGIGFFKSCPAFTLYSFSPSSITGPTTGCVMTGLSGTGPNTMGATAYVLYPQPASCNTNGFACITSTALCGNIVQTQYTFTFVTNILPDSIRAFGVEGNGNLLGGCYPNPDMLIDYCALNNCPFNFPMNCPGPQTLSVGSNCLATLPDYTGLANFPPPACPIQAPTTTQSPLAGTGAGAPGNVLSVSLFGHSGTFGEATCTFSVNVVDLTAPTVTCPATQSVTLNSSCQVTLPNYLALGTATDNCTSSPSIVQSPAAGTVLTGGAATTVTFSSTDGAGNTGTCSFLVTKLESTPPSITCPATQNVSLNNACQVTLANYIILATATDNCTASPTKTQSPAGGTVLSGLGSSTVTITATDGAGNTSTCSFLVMKAEGIPPIIVCPANANVSLDNACQVTLGDYTSQATASDNCTASPTVVQAPTTGTLLNGMGTSTVTLTASDGSGNTTSCTFTVTRADQTPPSIVCPPSVTVSVDNACQAVLANYLTLATTTDNCTAVSNIVQSPSAGTVLSGAGTTTVTVTATDGSGNTGTCTFTVTHQDQTPPVITCPASFSVTPIGLDCNPTATWATATTTDNCGATVQGSHASGDHFPVGATTVNYTATDGAGNTSTCSFTVTVLAPLIAGTTLQNPTNPCVGDVVTLTALGASSYAWSTAATTQSAQATTSGWYWVDVSDSSGCTARDSVFVTFSPLPQPVVNQSGNQVCTGTFASYQWFLNGNPIVGATGACTPITTSGNYSVQVTDNAGCIGSSGPLSLVGIGPKPGLNTFVVYPVPAQDVLSIQLAQPLATSGRIVLYDLTGKAVRHQEFLRLDSRTEFSLSGLAEGSYLLEVQAEGFRGVKQVVKLR